MIVAMLIMALLAVGMLYVSPMLVMMWDSPDAGYKPLMVVIPYFSVVIGLVLGDVFLFWRLFFT